MILLKCAHKFFMRIFRINAHLSVSIQRFFYAIIQNAHKNRWMETQLMIALAISLAECQEALSEGHFGKQTRYLLCLELMFAHEVLVLIPTHTEDFTDFFSGTFA